MIIQGDDTHADILQIGVIVRTQDDSWICHGWIFDGRGVVPGYDVADGTIGGWTPEELAFIARLHSPVGELIEGGV